MITTALPAQRRHRIVSVPTAGGDLAVGVWNPVPSRREQGSLDVVAIHGITGNHLCWTYLADTLKGSRVVAPDLRGRGRSSAVSGPFGLRTHADDVLRTLDTLGIDRTVLVGHSMGGFVATIAAHRHPDRVAALVLVDGGLPMTKEVPTDVEGATGRVLAHLRRRIETTFRSEADAIAWWRTHPAFVGAWSPVVGAYAAYDIGGRRPHLRSTVSMAAVTEDVHDSVTQPEIRASLDELAHPATFLMAPRGLLGTAPGIYPPDLAVHLFETYPQVEVQPVPRVNHYTIVLSRSGAEVVAATVRASQAGATSVQDVRMPLGPG